MKLQEGKVDNIIEKDDAREIDKPLLYKTYAEKVYTDICQKYFKPKFDVQK